MCICLHASSACGDFMHIRKYVYTYVRMCVFKSLVRMWVACLLAGQCLVMRLIGVPH